MGERGAGSGTMRPGASALDPKTVALVRAAAALAEGRITELEQRFREARAAGVPDLWVEELLLQSLLLVGYPLALVGFGVWREVTGPIARGGGGAGAGEELAHEEWQAWAERGAQVCAAVYEHDGSNARNLGKHGCQAWEQGIMWHGAVTVAFSIGRE